MKKKSDSLPQAAEDLQREYANQVIGIRGYLPNNSITEPTVSTFTIHTPTVRVGEEIDISDTFPSPPMTAYIGRIPLQIKTQVIRKTGMVKVKLIAPEGTRGGTVELKWPSKTLTSCNELLIVTKEMTLMNSTGKIGDLIALGLFPEKPDRVYLGSAEVASKDVHWQNGMLGVTIPKGVTDGPIFVITSTDIWQSDLDFVVQP